MNRPATQRPVLSGGYRSEIDGLRALAIIAVLINHIQESVLPSGYLGVDIFFVISGFVITASLLQRPVRSFADLVLGFYSRRLKRLVPALLLFVIVVGILASLVIPRPHTALRTGINALFGLSNIYLNGQSTDYFATSTQLNPFTHTWSLGVEEQVYLLFPLVVWLTGFGRRGLAGTRALFGVMAVSTLISLIAFVHLYPTRQAAAYFLMPTRLWELGAGCLLFCMGQLFPSLMGSAAMLPPVAVSLGLVAVLFLPLSWAVPATISAVVLTMLLIGCLRPGTTAYRMYTLPWVVSIGLLSYSVYLWHWGVLSLSRWTIGIHWWSLPFQIGLIGILSWLSYRWVEQPLRRASWSARRIRTIGMGVGGLATGAGLLIGIDNLPPFSLYAGHNPVPPGMGVESLREVYRVEGIPSAWGGKRCVLEDDRRAGKRIAIEDCTLGDFNRARHRVLVIGNSFSAAFPEAFDTLVRSDGFAVTITSAWAASPVKEIGSLVGSGPFAAVSQAYWNRVVPSLIDRLRPGDWVFLVNDMAMFSPPRQSPQGQLLLQTLDQGLSNLSDDLGARGVNLAVLHGLPFAREADCHPASAIPQWFSPFGGPCRMPGREVSLERRQPLSDLLERLEGEGRLRVVDVFDLFCPDSACTYRGKTGQILYRDEHSHPSAAAARLAAPTIRRTLLGPGTTRRQNPAGARRP